MRPDYKWIIEQVEGSASFTDNARGDLDLFFRLAEERFSGLPEESNYITLSPIVRELPKDVRDAVREMVREHLEQQRKRYDIALFKTLAEKFDRAINIILHQEGPDMKFIEIENDKGASVGVGVGEYLEQKGKYSKLRITAADIIDMEEE